MASPPARRHTSPRYIASSPSHAIPRRLFQQSNSSPHSPRRRAPPPPTDTADPVATYLTFSPSHHPPSSPPVNQSGLSRRSSSSSSGQGSSMSLHSGPLGGTRRMGSTGSNGGGPFVGFPESSIREESLSSSSPGGDGYQSEGISPEDVFGGSYLALARERLDDEMDLDRPLSSPIGRSNSSSSSSSYASTHSRTSSYPNPTGAFQALASLPLPPRTASSSPARAHSSSPSSLRHEPFFSRQSTLKSSALSKETSQPVSPASSEASLELDLMPSSPPAEDVIASAAKSLPSARMVAGEDSLGLQLGPPARTGVDAGEDAERRAISGLEMLKKRRGMLRDFEAEWNERSVAEEVEPSAMDVDVLGLELGPRRKVTLTIGANNIDKRNHDAFEAAIEPTSPADTAPPKTLAAERSVPIIRLRRVPPQTTPGPASSSDDPASPQTPPDELSSSSPIADLKGKRPMRVVQDRTSPSVPSSSPSAAKRARTSSSVAAEDAEALHARGSPTTTSADDQAALALAQLPAGRWQSRASSSSLSSLGPSPVAIHKQLSLSPYSSLEPASSYHPIPGSRDLTLHDAPGDHDSPLSPSPAPSSPLSSAPCSPPPVSVHSLPSATSALAAGPSQRVSGGRSLRNTTAQATQPAVDFPRRTFPPNLRIEPGYGRWYRSFSIPTPLASEVATALGLQLPAVFPPRALPSGKRNDGGRGPMDLYNPRWIKGIGSDKVAVCPICDEDSGVDAVAFKTKCSAFNYHLLHGHGICPSTGLPFSPPMAFRTVKRKVVKPDEKKTCRQGKCHSCKQWVTVEGVKDVEILVPEIYWWKHAKACHQSGRMPGDLDIWTPSPLLDQISTWIEGLPSDSKLGWVVPSQHRSGPPPAGPAASATGSSKRRRR